MYDPLVVDTFVATYTADHAGRRRRAPHPGGAGRSATRARSSAGEQPRESGQAGGGEVTDGLLAVTSLSRALTGAGAASPTSAR